MKGKTLKQMYSRWTYIAVEESMRADVVSWKRIQVTVHKVCRKTRWPQDDDTLGPFGDDP